MAQRIGAGRRDVLPVVPGLWESIRQSHLDEIGRGDARGYGLTEAEREAINALPNSTVSAARAALVRMDAREPVVTWPPSRRRFPAAAEVRWLADRSASRVIVWPDDSVEPA